jgi:RNA polymerase sigma-70 factor (ECF subfamily)
MRATEQGLVDAFLSGEDWAIRVVDGWIEQAAARFRRTLQPDWEDATQEARLETVRLLARGAFRGEACLRTYLWRVVSNTCIDALRRRQRRRDVALEDAEPALPLNGTSPIDGLLDRERCERAHALIAAMRPSCRRLWTSLLDGESYQSISGRVGVSEAALRVRAHRCCKAASRAEGLRGVRTARASSRARRGAW